MEPKRSLLARLTIGKKCLLLTLVNTGLLLAVAGTGLWGIYQISSGVRDTLHVEAQIRFHAIRAQNDVLNLRRCEKDAFLNCLDVKAVAAYSEKFHAALASLISHLDALRDLVRLEENRQRVARMRADLDIYTKAMGPVLEKAQTGGFKTPQEGNQAMIPFKDVAHELEQLTGETAQKADELMDTSSADLVHKGSLTLLTMGILSGVALTLGVVLSTLVSRGITQPLQRMTAVLENIAKGAGDLTQQVRIDTEDEVGTLGALVNALIRRIHDLIVPIRVATIQLNATATEIAATAAEQNGTVQSFNASTTEIAASARQISATSTELTRTMGEVTERAQEATSLADAGRTGLEQMEATMQQLSEATGSISTKLGTIREKADGINVVVTTITKVADQTNLLSINAAIEAEKAGEAGRGFLVVAREIRRLVDQTAVATLDIEQMVRHMQSAVSAGVMEMDRFSDRVRGCMGQAEEVSRQIGQILEQVHNLSARFQAVTEGMGQQSEGARQIGEAITQLAASVQQVSGSVREFSSAADNLRDATQSLHHQVGHFTVAS